MSEDEFDQSPTWGIEASILQAEERYNNAMYKNTMHLYDAQRKHKISELERINHELSEQLEKEKREVTKAVLRIHDLHRMYGIGVTIKNPNHYVPPLDEKPKEETLPETLQQSFDAGKDVGYTIGWNEGLEAGRSQREPIPLSRNTDSILYWVIAALISFILSNFL